MMADFILKKKNVVAYLDFHAYSQLWMSPFGADCAQTPKDDEDIIEGGMLRDTGKHGFLLPESEILPSSEETMAGVVSLASFIRKREKQWGYMV
ncbi:corticosteroid- binding protein [Haplosporangium bisporale]|nr:corticosteroid- binding protein [Haplosporangium bisporale]